MQLGRVEEVERGADLVGNSSGRQEVEEAWGPQKKKKNESRKESQLWFFKPTGRTKQTALRGTERAQGDFFFFSRAEAEPH